jgi:hypothetical protein
VKLARPGARRRWSIVSAAVAVLVSVPLVRSILPVSAAQIDPQLLRSRILAAAARPYQGYVESQGILALPSIPQLGDVKNLFGASNSMRVWHAAPDAWRVAVLDPAGEQDYYRTADGSYTWDYKKNLWTQIIGDPPVRLPSAPDVLPPELARRLLAGETAVKPIAARRVAGVATAGLRFTPSDPDTTIRYVDVWADPSTGLPVQIDVGGVFSARFLELTQKPPPADVISPKAASSSGFATTDRPDITTALNSVASATLPGTLAGRPRVPGPVNAAAVYGTGLSRFVVLALPGRIARQTFNAIRNGGGANVPGGYVLGSGAVTVLVSRTAPRRTYLLAGFVTADLLTRAAAELR